MTNGRSVLVEDPNGDLEIVEGMIPQLEDYIIKDEVYRTVILPTSEGDLNIRMTGGDLLARLHRLQGVRDSLSAGQRQRIDAAQSQADAIIRSLKTRFNQRLLREMKARLDSLKWYFDDCASDKQRCRTEFPFEMRNRQRIEEIVKHAGKDVPDDLRSLLSQTDKRIREIAQPSAFIWSKAVEKAYPRDTYWYLYMMPS